MVVVLRPYQQKLKDDIYRSWQTGNRNIVMRLDTGGGKTAIFANIINEHNGPCCVIVHRNQIVSQISLTLARLGLYHDVIASDKTLKLIAELHTKILKKVYLRPGAKCRVASVDTLIRRKNLGAWAASVTLWITDEGHHLVLDNKWHTAIEMFSHSEIRGLLPTASPERPDGKGLGCVAIGGSGVAHAMVEGPYMRWLIDQGYLSDYRAVIADSHITELLDQVGKSGDWSTKQLRKASQQTPIVGNAVETFGTWGRGKTGINFCSDIETAKEMLSTYRQAGYRAELITGETDETYRVKIFQRIEERDIDIVFAVDVVSEGVDLPALDIGQFTRPTASLIVYMQQFGRLLRPIYAPGFDLDTTEGRLAAIATGPKPFALVIDHVGNFLHRHGPPDRQRIFSLANKPGSRSGGSNYLDYQVCSNFRCAQPFEKYRTVCPFCKTPVPPPQSRAHPAMVAGDMVLLDPAILERLRGEATTALLPIDDYRAHLAAKGLPQRFIWSNAKSHAQKLERRQILREVMELWGGYRKSEGLTDREMQRLFFERFHVDVVSAPVQDVNGLETLIAQISEDIGNPLESLR